MPGRTPFSFLNFADELKLWYFKYITGAVLVTLILAALTVYLTISRYTEIITLQGLQLPGTSSPPINLAKEMLLNAQSGLMKILALEGIILLAISLIISMYFAYRIMGPVRRIDREISYIVQGLSQVHPITLRKGDYLFPVVEIINKLIEVVGRKQETIEEYHTAIKGFQDFLRKEKIDV